VLGIEPPDKFPLVYYRDNASDSQVNIDDVVNANIPDYKILLINGTALNVEPSRSATFYAAEIANQNNVDVVLDLDFRADQWHDYRAFGVTVRAVLPGVKIAIGTEEEILAATMDQTSQVTIKDQQISAPEIIGDIDKSIEQLLATGIETLIVKRGEKGASIYMNDGSSEEVAGFPVDILNVLGAGDAFASGFLYGILQGWDLKKACRMGNASGAQVVTKKGCANFMPTLQESLSFIEERGGF
jgi:5-dehydro-2-deoxygluconokinase